MTTAPPVPSEHAFERFDLGDDLLQAIARAGFSEPRPIQAKTIPQALEGRDVLGLAQTGTGKTAAFALPMIERLLMDDSPQPRGLILAPTRELAAQIQADIVKLGRYTDISAVAVFGGVSAVAQTKALRKKPDIIVACPGRLLDLVRSGNANLDAIEILVLDEADHMLDMGFLPDIRRVLSCLPVKRQNLLFSATMPREIRKLADEILYRPHIVELAHSAPAETVEHALYPVADPKKTDLLRHVIAGERISSAIVFTRTKHRARRLAKDLIGDGFSAIALQGNMNQSQRKRAMDGFRDGKYEILVATDIAARGIDVEAVSHVINFDVPDTPDAYTHRIGRTGRAERSGMALTFAAHHEFSDVKDIERKLGIQLPRIKLKQFGGSDAESPRTADRVRGRNARGGNRGGGGGGRGDRPPQRKASSSRRKRRRPSGNRSIDVTPSGEGSGRRRPAPSGSRSAGPRDGHGTRNGSSGGSSSRSKPNKRGRSGRGRPSGSR